MERKNYEHTYIYHSLFLPIYLNSNRNNFLLKRNEKRISTYMHDSPMSSKPPVNSVQPAVLITEKYEKHNGKLIHSLFNSDEFLFIQITD